MAEERVSFTEQDTIDTANAILDHLRGNVSSSPSHAPDQSPNFFADRPWQSNEPAQAPESEQERLYRIQKEILEKIYDLNVNDPDRRLSQRERVQKYNSAVHYYKGLLTRVADYKLVPRINLETLKEVADNEFRLAQEAVGQALPFSNDAARTRVVADRWSRIQEIAADALK